MFIGSAIAARSRQSHGQLSAVLTVDPEVGDAPLVIFPNECGRLSLWKCFEDGRQVG